VFDPSGNDIFIKEAIIPPLPIKEALYRCDRIFRLDNIIPLFEIHEQLGIIVVGGELCEIWVKEHSRLERLRVLTIHRQKHQKKGGQSQMRFARTRLNQISEWISHICETIIEVLPKSVANDVVIGGNGEIFERLCTSTADSGLTGRIRQTIRVDVLTINAVCSRLTITPGSAAAIKKAEELFNALDAGDGRVIYGRAAIAAAGSLVDYIIAIRGAEVPDNAILVEEATPVGIRLAAFGGILAMAYSDIVQTVIDM